MHQEIAGISMKSVDLRRIVSCVKTYIQVYVYRQWFFFVGNIYFSKS